jgi:hypothetical protein
MNYLQAFKASARRFSMVWCRMDQGDRPEDSRPATTLRIIGVYSVFVVLLWLTLFLL